MLLKKYFIVITLVQVSLKYCVAGYLDILPDKHVHNTVDCINKILTECFRCGTLATFVNPDRNDDHLIGHTNEDNICHSIITRSYKERDWFVWTNVYIITAENLRELWNGMLYLSRDVFWNPRAKFIVHLMEYEPEEIPKAFSIFLKYKIYNVMLLESTHDDVIIYSYDTFKNHNCGKKFDELVTLGTYRTFDSIKHCFPNTAKNGLKNCLIRVVASDNVPNFISEARNFTLFGKRVLGLEQFLLETIASREKFSIEYKVFEDDETYGNVLPNYTTTGLLHYLENDKADIVAGGFQLMLNRVRMFDYIWGSHFEAFNLFTPTLGGQTWKRVYREFGGTTWTFIGVVLFTVAVSGKILAKVLDDRTYSIMNLWGYFFGNANKGLSQHKSLRVLVLGWAWFAFFISNFYNTALYSLVTLRIHDKPHYFNFDDLKALPYKPCISDDTRLSILYSYNRTLPENDPPNHNCTYTEGALDYVTTKKDHYAIELDYSYTLQLDKYLDKEGRSTLDAWVFSDAKAIVMYLTRGFAFRNEFQRYGTRLFESGLIKNQLNTIHLKSSTVIQKQPKFFRKVNLTDLMLHFIILLVGFLLSFGCFLLEIWYNYSMQERNKPKASRFK